MKKNFFVMVIFLILIIIVTFPLVFKITTYIPGFYSTDEPFVGLWDSWRIKYSLENNLSLRYTPLIVHPFGLDLRSSGYNSYILSNLYQLLSKLTAPAFTWNFQVFLNIFLSLFFTYLLVLYLTQNRLISFLGGLIFGFCPYQLVRAWQHLGLTYNQWIPLILLSAILLKERGKGKYSLLFLLSLLLLLSFDFSIMYLGSTALAMFFIYLIFYQCRVKLFKEKKRVIEDLQYIKQVLLIGVIAFAILSPQFLPIIKNRLLLSSVTKASAFNAYHRPFEDLFAQSAKPLSYLLPAAMHPVFGKFTEQFIGSPLYGISFTEHTLYLGWVPMILAVYAIRRWRKDRRIRGQSPAGALPANNEDFYIGFFIFLAIAAWLFSQPPWWKFGPIKIFMPSFFMYKILPMYRAYCRFGIVVMLAVAVLAGFGLKFILERFKSQKTKITVTCLFSGLVLFEFWNWPPYKVIDVSRVPAVYYWLKSNPGDFAIAEYPLDYNGSNEMYKFYQTEHEKKIINGTIPGTYANKVARTITKLSDPKTAEVLKWMGVKYVFVHRNKYLRTELVDEIGDLNRIPLNSGLRLIKSFPSQECLQKDIMCTRKAGPIDVYEVVASAVKPEIRDIGREP